MIAYSGPAGATSECQPFAPEDSVIDGGRASERHVRVLVAENSEPERFLTLKFLRQAWPFSRSMVAECATDGTEALEKIRRLQFGLVVLDWDMPLKHGATVLRAVRESGVRVPVVVVSGQRREAIARHLDSMAAGFVDKKEMDAISFRNAIVASILLQEGVFGWVRSGHDASMKEWLKQSKGRSRLGP